MLNHSRAVLRIRVRSHVNGNSCPLVPCRKIWASLDYFFADFSPRREHSPFSDRLFNPERGRGSVSARGGDLLGKQ